MPDTEILVPSVPLGEQIDALQKLVDLKELAEAVVEGYKARIVVIEQQIQATMEVAGIIRAAGSLASVSITESVVPQVEDWELFYKFIRKNNAFELLERRAAAGAYREHAEHRRDKTVPGVVPYTKRKLSRRGN